MISESGDMWANSAAPSVIDTTAGLKAGEVEISHQIGSICQ
jgi:hypothetical protein